MFERQELLLFGKEHKLVVNWGAGVQILWSPNWRQILSWSWVELFPGLITWEARDNLTSPFQCKNILWLSSSQNFHQWVFFFYQCNSIEYDLICNRQGKSVQNPNFGKTGLIWFKLGGRCIFGQQDGAATFFSKKISVGPLCLNMPPKSIVTFNSHTCPMDKQLKWRYLRFHTQCLELLPRVKWWRREFSSWCNIFGKILLLAQLRSSWEYFSLFRNGQSRVWGPLRWHYMQKANLTL